MVAFVLLTGARAQLLGRSQDRGIDASPRGRDMGGQASEHYPESDTHDIEGIPRVRVCGISGATSTLQVTMLRTARQKTANAVHPR